MIQVANDGKLWLSSGRDRFEQQWKNQEWTWAQLLNKLEDKVVTRETHQEYMAMDRPRQDTIKDVGGFVGGTILNGRRVKNSVTTRSLITLDLDDAPADLFDELTLVYGYSLAIYPTHKHTEKNPRYRLLFPLKREAHADEYQAIARKLAEDISMCYMDPTTFQPERLMYWPSIPVDIEYVMRFQDGPWLDPDEWLGRYKDWKDMSQWPRHEKEQKKLHDKQGEQGDPLKKTGVIGAFCRTFTIQRAIDEYLDGVYVISENMENRYTYLHGSTANGVTIYDDKFSYSYHATDPASLILCNAFDLVRLHRFKDLDREVADQTPVNRLPSFMAMNDLATQSAEVRQLIGEEKLQEAMLAFDDRDDPAQGVPSDALLAIQDMDTTWLQRLTIDTNGNYRNTIENMCLVLRHDPNLTGALAMNNFTVRPVCRRALPWHHGYEPDQAMDDDDMSGLRWYMETLYKLTATAKLQDAVNLILRENSFHPILDYLKVLTWDGVERLETMLVDYLGAEDAEYVRNVTRKEMIAAVARVNEPGVKYDNILVPVGAQGIGKSTLIRKLGMGWYSDSFGNLKNNSAMEQIQGVWLMEVGELAGLKRAEVEEIKLFISKQVDEFRPSYGKLTKIFKRQCVFWGTTNNEDFLQDQTGNRRFWPVMCYHLAKKDVFTMPQAVVDQLWAEARYHYDHGEQLHLTKEVEAQAKLVQAQHMELDDRLPAVIEYLNKPLPKDWAGMDIWKRREFLRAGADDLGPAGTEVRESVTVGEIWCECLESGIKEMNRFNTKELHRMMRGLSGWAPGTRTKGAYGNQLRYLRLDVLKDEDWNI